MRINLKYLLVALFFPAVSATAQQNEINKCDHLKLYIGDTRFSDKRDPIIAFKRVKNDAEIFKGPFSVTESAVTRDNG